MNTNEKTTDPREVLLVQELKQDQNVSQVGNTIMSLIMAVIGIVLLCMYDRTFEVRRTVLIIAGIAFVVPGAALLLHLLVSRKDHPKGTVMSFITAICGLAALVIGIVVLVSPDTFANLVVYLFGGLLIIAAAWQFDVMMRKNRGTRYPAWLAIAPIVTVTIGVVMCTMEYFKGEANEKHMILAAGIGFALFGLIGLCITYYALRSAHHAKKVKEAATAELAKDTTPAPADTSDKSDKSDTSDTSDSSAH